MGNQIHTGTFLWGLVLTAIGAGLLGVGVGWWDFELVDLRYALPILIIAIGAAVLIGSLTQKRRPEGTSQ